MLLGSIDYVSDWVIAISYFAIPIEMLYFARQYHINQVAARTVLGLFVLFITACGITHVCNAQEWTTSNHYFKLITAVVSFATAVTLTQVIPNIFALPGKLAEMDDEFIYESNLRVFNQTIVLCTRNLNEPHIVKLASETLKYMFPAGRLAVVERGVQLRHGLHEVSINEKYVILVEPDLYIRNKRFFDDVAQQISMQQRDFAV